MTAKALGGSLASGRGGLTGLLKDQIQPEIGLERADRFIHRIQWKYQGGGLRTIVLLIIERMYKYSIGTDGIRTRDLLRDRQTC